MMSHTRKMKCRIEWKLTQKKFRAWNMDHTDCGSHFRSRIKLRIMKYTYLYHIYDALMQLNLISMCTYYCIYTDALMVCLMHEHNCAFFSVTFWWISNMNNDSALKHQNHCQRLIKNNTVKLIYDIVWTKVLDSQAQMELGSRRMYIWYLIF